MDKVVDLFLNDATTRQKWENLLESLGLNDFSEREVNVIDHTIGLEDEEGNLVGTGSVAGNVLKYIGVKNDADTQGARFNKVVTALTQYLTNDGIFHSFVFTKAKYATSFEHLHFNLLAKTDQAAFLENGMPDVKEFVAEVPEIADQEHKKVAAIVMNANPFTLGHQHLIKMASEENDLVYLDPPYLITFSEYNKLWNESIEQELLEILNELNIRQIRFAISNVTHYKGKTNSLFLNWAENYNIHPIKSNYISYHDNSIKQFNEVLVTNF